MKSLVALTAVMVTTGSCLCQDHFKITEVPVFNSVSDSIAYTNAHATFRKIIAGQLMNLSADNVLKQMRAIGERSITGTIKTYKGSTGFLPYDSLLLVNNPSVITMLSISDVKVKRLPREVYKCQQLESLEVVNTRIKHLSRLNKLPNLKRGCFASTITILHKSLKIY